MAGGKEERQHDIRVFICYRRDDVPGYAGRLYDQLAHRFGDDRVFMDVDAIRPGTDFTEVIDGALGQCDVFLAVIGDEWLTSEDDAGRRRLDAPGDFVRLELEAALRRGIPIIPLLFQSATMPSATRLPVSLASLARRQALEMSDSRWRTDVEELVSELDRLARAKTIELPPVIPTEPARRRTALQRRLPRGRPLAFIAGAVVLTLLGIVAVTRLEDPYLHEPRGVTVTADGAVYVSDKDRIFRFQGNGDIEAYAGGKGGAGVYGDGGPASAAVFAEPRGLAWERATNSLFVADHFHSKVRKIAADGTIETVAGSGQPGDEGDGGPATSAKLSTPGGVAVANDGTLYIADTKNNRIRKVSGRTITNWAGRGLPGFDGDNGLATRALLSGPEAVAVTPEGVLYIADTGNHRIRRVDASGVITTVAGGDEGTFSGEDVDATLARLLRPAGIAVAGDGVLYVADTGNNRVRKIADGKITTVAGNGTTGLSGDGGQARRASLSAPYGVGVRPDGTLVIADSGNNQIRTVAPNGVIRSVG